MMSRISAPGIDSATWRSPVTPGVRCSESQSVKPAHVSVRRNFFLVLAGNTAYAASQWLMLILLTKLTTPERVGQFALALALTGPLILFANLQLRSVQATDASDEFSFPDYFTLRLVAVTLAVACVSCLAFFGGYRSAVGQVIFALGAARGVECLSEIYLGLFQRRDRMDLIARSLILKAVLSLTAFAIAILFTQSLVVAVWGLFLAWAVVLIGYDIPNGRRVCAKDSRRRWLASGWNWLRLGGLALPLGIAAMLKATENSLPRYFIELQMGERELGLFAAAAYLTIVGIQFVTALGQAAAPRLASLHAAGEQVKLVRLIWKLLASGLAIGLVGLVGAFFIGRPLLALVYTPEYADYHGVFTWLVAAATLHYVYVLLGTSLNALRVFRFRLPVHVFGVVILAIGCITLGRSYGLLGMAWAVGIAEFFTAGVYAGVLIVALRRAKTTAASAEITAC